MTVQYCQAPTVQPFSDCSKARIEHPLDPKLYHDPASGWGKTYLCNWEHADTMPIAITEKIAKEVYGVEFGERKRLTDDNEFCINIPIQSFYGASEMASLVDGDGKTIEVYFPVVIHPTYYNENKVDLDKWLKLTSGNKNEQWFYAPSCSVIESNSALMACVKYTSLHTGT